MFRSSEGNILTTTGLNRDKKEVTVNLRLQIIENNMKRILALW